MEIDSQSSQSSRVDSQTPQDIDWEDPILRRKRVVLDGKWILQNDPNWTMTVSTEKSLRNWIS